MALKTKDQFITSHFVRDFPAFAGLSYKEVVALCSRSGRLSKWLSSELLNWVEYSTTPDLILEAGLLDQYQESVKVIDLYASLLSDKGLAVKKASDEYKKKIADIDSMYDAKIKQFEATPLVHILNFNSQNLAPEVHLRLIRLKISEDERRIETQKEVKELKKQCLKELQEGKFDLKKYSF